MSLICIYCSALHSGLVEIQVSLKRVSNKFVYVSPLGRTTVSVRPLRALRRQRNLLNISQLLPYKFDHITHFYGAPVSML